MRAQLRVQVFRHKLPFAFAVKRPVRNVTNDFVIGQFWLHQSQLRLFDSLEFISVEVFRIDELLVGTAASIPLRFVILLRWNDVSLQVQCFRVSAAFWIDKFEEMLLLRNWFVVNVEAFVIVVQRIMFNS